MRLQHVSITIPRAADARAQAIAFYGQLIGLERRDVPPRLDPDSLIWFKAGDELELHLVASPDAPSELAHFCLDVAADLEDIRLRLERAGVQTTDATEIVGRPRFFCRDPFGNLIEFTRIEATD